MARTYNESQSVFLCGPIEWWWDTEDEPDRFNSWESREYRRHRDSVRDFFVARHYLVYSPHAAFKGDWNEKMQPVNDYVLSLCDIVVNLSPPDVPGEGTAHEWELAHKLDKIMVEIPPGTSMVIIEMMLETERLTHGYASYQGQ
jgi:hypothetical protein